MTPPLVTIPSGDLCRLSDAAGSGCPSLRSRGCPRGIRASARRCESARSRRASVLGEDGLGRGDIDRRRPCRCRGRRDHRASMPGGAMSRDRARSSPRPRRPALGGHVPDDRSSPAAWSAGGWRPCGSTGSSACWATWTPRPRTCRRASTPSRKSWTWDEPRGSGWPRDGSPRCSGRSAAGPGC